MIIRILIVLILLLSVLNIVGQPAHTDQLNQAVQQTPPSLSPIVEILSALTVLLLCQNYLNRQLNKIKTSALKAKLNRRLFHQRINPGMPLYSNSLQQG
ncbi:hypothetical protein [Mucilaginibacter gilvus]|uniref:Uncharacterized protein n=1 Tax=Mucilaginibacter gilvus TaxID=2305909 RepID=A0A444MT77_9SPHI|nr:hypothetical protein [Mucilaginibacter gilvus]RWY55805.1 hypothetical protein EPL05_05365 [Mucilaginibacter gilvus]